MCLPGGKCILQLILQRGFQCRRLLGLAMSKLYHSYPRFASWYFRKCWDVCQICRMELFECLVPWEWAFLGHSRRFVQGTCTFEDRIQYRFWRKWRLGMSWLWIDLLTIKAVCKGVWQEPGRGAKEVLKSARCQNRPALHHCTAPSYCDGKATWRGWHVKLLLMRSC